LFFSFFACLLLLLFLLLLLLLLFLLAISYPYELGSRFAKLFAPQGIQGYVGTQYIETSPNANSQNLASFNQQSPNYQGL
jgi:hypothetical protein